MSRLRPLLLFLFVFLVVAWAVPALAKDEAVFAFPPPDLGEQYQYPSSSQANARSDWLAIVDTLALLGALIAATYFSLRIRSRRAIVYLSIVSLIYFGFYRKGCVCSVGSLQNVARALFDSSYIVPWTVLAFFVLPLAFTLVFGRVFCAGVCPLGALQDLVLVKPHRVPKALDQGLSLFRYVYLGFAVLFASIGTTYLICRYDPFVGFFRFSARFHIWIWSGVILVLSMFVGRPYCRYLCPYGALLGILARFSVRKASITPDECIVCGLCADSCPYGAIREGGQHEK